MAEIERLRAELGMESGMRAAAVDEIESLRRSLWTLLGVDQLSDEDTLRELRYQLSLVRHWHDRYEQLRARDDAAAAVVQVWARPEMRPWAPEGLRGALDALARAHHDGGQNQ